MTIGTKGVLEPPRRLRPGFEVIATAAVLAVQLAALVYVAVQNRFNLNPDAIAYLQIARHIAEGKLDLAVNGYWGPLLSWIMAPLLAAGIDPLVTARSAMVVSAMVFLAGAMSLFRSVGLRRLPFLAISLLTASISLAWSVETITPDLLAGGLLLFACSRAFAAEWPESRSAQVASGIAWGVGYMAKAVVLPIAVAVTVLAGLAVARSVRARRQALRAAGVSLLLTAITAAPWIATLSLKYRKPTFSTSGPIAHALVGPSDVDRRNPLVLGFRTPEPGRLIVSEDPTVVPFRYWSPFSSTAYARHQFAVCRQNAPVIISRIKAFSSFEIGFWSLVAVTVLLLARPLLILGNRWLLVPIPVVVAALIYMPVWANDARYYYFAYPLAAVAATGLAGIAFGRWRSLAVALMLLVLLFFLFPVITPVRIALHSIDNPSVDVARRLADRLELTRRTGPVAGVGDVDGSMAGLYLAYFLDVPWVGDEPELSLIDLRRSNAFVYVRSKSDRDVIAQLEQDGAFGRVDTTLFPAGEASSFPLAVFVRKGGEAGKH